MENEEPIENQEPREPVSVERREGFVAKMRGNPWIAATLVLGVLSLILI